MKIFFVMLISLLLSACSIGNGRICGPQTPKANCNKEVYEKLVNPKPYLEYWEKQNTTPEQRREDAFDCGGRRSDTHPDGFDYEKVKLPNESVFETRERFQKVWRNCMEDKGYRYVPDS